VAVEEILENWRRVTPATVVRAPSGDAAPDAGPQLDDAVDCSIFAPPNAAPGSPLFIQVFAHLPTQAAEAAARAAEFDDQAARRGVSTLEVPVARDDILTFHLAMNGIEIAAPVQRLRWRGRPTAVQFEAVVPQQFPSKSAIGTLTVGREGVDIGQLKFTVKIDAGLGLASATITGDEARRFTKAFVSYASADRAAVLARVQVLRAAGIAYFQDVDMDPGQRWENELYRQIEGCDLFLLFWSQAAKDSIWVRREVQFALDLAAKAPAIRPVVIEGPPAPLPWEELAALHFDDRVLSLMAALPTG
jgi:hypothetical protein